MIRRFSVLVPAATIAVILLWGCASAAGPPDDDLPWGAGFWGANRLPLAEIQRRARFQLLLPRKVDGQPYPLWRSEIVWTARDIWDSDYPPIPPRQAVCLYHRLTDKGMTVVVQARAVPKVQPASSILIIVGQGYFTQKPPLDAEFRFGRKGATDFGVISTELRGDELDHFAHSLAPIRDRGGRSR